MRHRRRGEPLEAVTRHVIGGYPPRMQATCRGKRSCAIVPCIRSLTCRPPRPAHEPTWSRCYSPGPPPAAHDSGPSAPTPHPGHAGGPEGQFQIHQRFDSCACRTPAARWSGPGAHPRRGDPTPANGRSWSRPHDGWQAPPVTRRIHQSSMGKRAVEAGYTLVVVAARRGRPYNWCRKETGRAGKHGPECGVIRDGD
jgi:hypothetical protein